MRLKISLLACALSGCAAMGVPDTLYGWTKPGVSDQQMRVDADSCWAMAYEKHPYRDLGAEQERVSRRNDALRSKGLPSETGAGLELSEEYQKGRYWGLGQQCMNLKGYDRPEATWKIFREKKS